MGSEMCIRDRVLASQGTDHDQIWGVYAPLSVESSLPCLRAVGDLDYVSRYRLGRRGLTQFCINFLRCDRNKVIQKSGRLPRPEVGQTPTSRPRISRHGPPTASNLAARTLSLAERTLSKLCRDPCPVRRGLVAAVKCCVRKARFFRCPGRLWNKTREARALCGFQHHKGEKKIVFCFPIPQLSALGQQLSYQKTENKTDFPFIVLKPASSAVGSDRSFLDAAYTRKNMLFAHST